MTGPHRLLITRREKKVCSSETGCLIGMLHYPQLIPLNRNLFS